MKAFDPSLPAMLFDCIDDQTVQRSPATQVAYCKYATELAPGVISFNGVLIDGWEPVVIDAGRPLQRLAAATKGGAGRSMGMTHPKPTPPTEASEIERLNPGSNRERLPQPQPPRPLGQRNKAALPGSQNSDLQGPKPKRGPRGAST
jgi:hypothetical protein